MIISRARTPALMLAAAAKATATPAPGQPSSVYDAHGRLAFRYQRARPQ